MRFFAGFGFIVLSALPPVVTADAAIPVKHYAFPWQEALAPKAAKRDRFVIRNLNLLAIAGDAEDADDDNIHSGAEPDPLLVSVENRLRDLPLPPVVLKMPHELIADVPVEQVCSAMAMAAQEHGLPVPFLARLIWQESGFRQRVVSHAGALGVAQFMPKTAEMYELHNPFDPIASVGASARFLRELYVQFGNIGLAAAAYNAGPRRVQDWIAQRGGLPDETRNYVKTITGHPAESWIETRPIEVAAHLPKAAPCEGVAGLSRSANAETVPVGLSAQIAGIVAEGKERAERAAKAKAERLARLAKAKKDKTGSKETSVTAETGASGTPASIAAPETRPAESRQSAKKAVRQASAD